jgi:hypothetical protein
MEDGRQALTDSVFLQFHQDVFIGVIVEIAQLMGLAGLEEERLALLIVAVANFPLDRSELDPAAGHRHDQIGQVVTMHAFDSARWHREAPNPDRVILEDDLVTDRPEFDVGSCITCHDDPPLACVFDRACVRPFFVAIAARRR